MRRASLAVRNRRLISVCAAALVVGGFLAHPPAWGQQYVTTDPPEHPRLVYPGTVVTLNDRCPVRQAKLNPTYKPVYVNRKPIAFCCMACPGVFVQDPERYLKALQITPPSVFQKGSKPIVDSSLRYRIGFEIYYFSSRAEMDRFKKDPLPYCGDLTDPVTMARFRPTADSPHIVYANRTYYFASDSTLSKFLEKPEQHKDRHNGLS